MLLSVLIFVLQILGSFSNPLDLNMVQPKIVNGLPAVPVLDNQRKFAFEVSLRRKNKHVCGGSIISPTKILTAAHCLKPEKKTPDIKLGIYDIKNEPGQVFTISKITIHPNFDRDTLLHDIAIVTLSSHIVFNSKTKIIPLRSREVSAKEILTVSGWGKTSRKGHGSNVLNYIEMEAINAKKCSQILRHSRFPIRSSHVCTVSTEEEPVGTCDGDSGGPLIDDENKLVGVVSWGKGCAKGYPDVFTSVAYHYDWIQNNI